MTSTRTFFTGLLMGGALLALSTPAYAADGAWGNDIEIIPDTEMKDLRGGIGIPGMPNINFAIVITTLMNGTPVVTTNLTVDETGAMLQQTVGNIGENIADLSDDALGQLGLAGLRNAVGVIINDDAGVTALVHNITDGSLQNIIVNRADGRDLAQNIDVTLDMPGFDAVQRSFLDERFGIHITDELAPYLD